MLYKCFTNCFILSCSILSKSQISPHLISTHYSRQPNVSKVRSAPIPSPMTHLLVSTDGSHASHPHQDDLSVLLLENSICNLYFNYLYCFIALITFQLFKEKNMSDTFIAEHSGLKTA